MTSECAVCISQFTEKVRKNIQCASCKYSCCLECIKTYLMGTPDEPHCMNCRKGWDRDYQYEILGTSFVNVTLKKHQKKLLHEKECARIPSTQPYVDYLIKKENLESEMDKIQLQIRELRMKHYKLRQECNNLNTPSKDDKPGTKILLKCPHTSCKGYLSGSKCNICKNKICRDCMTVINTDLDEHICDEDTKKSAQLILKETRACPGCSERIYKIHGCDQMWCTMCNIAFSWNTGKQITGVIHNPHYYDWLNNQNNHSNIRNPGDVVCGGLIPYNNVVRVYKLTNKHICSREIKEIHQIITHLQYSVINQYRRDLQYNLDNKLRHSRAEYMLNRITEEKWKRRIITIENNREKKQTFLHIFETFVTLITERFNEFITSSYITNDNTRYDENYPYFREEIRKIGEFITERNCQALTNFNIKSNDEYCIRGLFHVFIPIIR